MTDAAAAFPYIVHLDIKFDALASDRRPAPRPDAGWARPRCAEVALLRPYFSCLSSIPNRVQLTMPKALVWI